MQSGPLRGRGEPLARVLSVVRGVCRSGGGAAVVVHGPSGIGKTAFLAEVCQQADRIGARVSGGSCDPVGLVSPGAPVIAALRSGRKPLVDVAEYKEIVRAVDEPLLLAERIASALEAAAASGPLVLAVDDIQWADQVSRFVIRTLLGRLIGLPVVWLFAGREQEPVADVLGHDSDRVEWVRLGPLTACDLAAIAVDRLGRVPDERTRGYLDAAAGNPLLATQILESVARAKARGMSERVPLEFDALIAQRLAELADAPREMVSLIAVAGRGITHQDIVGLLPHRLETGWETVVTAAVDSGLVEVRAEVLMPRHHLVGQAVCAALPEATVRSWHRALAEHHLNSANDAPAAAAHARAAVTTGDVTGVLMLITAAERLATIAPEDAGDLAALAFRTVHVGQDEWLPVGKRCLSVLCRTQRAAEAISVADAILARVDDDELLGAVECDAARALWLSGRLDELLARTAPVLDVAHLDPRVSARLRAARALANTRLLSGREAAVHAEAALAAARTSGDREATATALHAVGEAARNEGRHVDALRSFRELRALTGASHLAEEITALQFLDRYGHAQTLLDEVRSAHGETTGSILPALQCARLWQDFNLGRSDEADAGARTLLEIGRELGNGVYALDAVIVQISVALLRGETHAAAARLEFAEGLVGADDAVRRPALTVMRGWLAACQGNLAGAIESYWQVAQGGTDARSYWPLWPCWMGMFFETGTAANDSRVAGLVVEVAELAASRNPGVASFEGLALNVRGRSKGDLGMLTEAAEVLARSPRPVLRAFGADCLGRALLADGDRTAALTQLDRAWDDYHRMDARVYRAGVQRVMREAGARRAKWSSAVTRPETGVGSLTEAERRVALLIADGHSNRSAAGELGVSVNTIGTHLRTAFSKLGVQSRVQLANALRSELSGDPT